MAALDFFLNIDQLRKETLGCEHVIHFNNAGSALPPDIVVNAIKNHIDLEAYVGGYEAALVASDKINNFYVSAAKLINCQKQEIAFMENATRAWDLAFYSLNLQPGDKILTATSEYVSNYLAFLHKAQTTGVIIELIKNDDSGQIDVADLETKIDNSVKLIAITHVPTNGGLINPAKEIGKIAKKHGITYLLDATQSVGQMPIDVQLIGCDFLCATGRKYLRGPRGTGFLFASSKIVDRCVPPFIELQSATWIENNKYEINKTARRFETWEHYVAGKIGLGAAIDYALNLGVEPCWQRIFYLASLLRATLSEIPNVILHDQGTNQCGIVTFTCNNKTAHEIQRFLADNKINVSVSLLEYARIDMTTRGLNSLVRASVHYYNNENEILKFCEILTKFTLGQS